MKIDTTNMCSHLQKKLFEEDGVYHHLWTAMQDDSELTAIVRSRQLHIYRNGKKVLVLEMSDIRRLLGQYFAKQAEDAIDRLWDEGVLNDDVIEGWKNEHL